MDTQINKILLDTRESSYDSSMNFSAHESDVGSFIGDKMTSDSASFEGFDMSLASSELVAPSGSSFKNKINENKTPTSDVFCGAELTPRQQMLSNKFNTLNNDSWEKENNIPTMLAFIHSDILEQSSVDQTTAIVNIDNVKVRHESEATFFVNSSKENIGKSNFMFLPQNEYSQKENPNLISKKNKGENELITQGDTVGYQYDWPTVSHDQTYFTGKGKKHDSNAENVNISNNDFKIDFSVVKGLSKCHSFLDTPQVDFEINSHLVTPPSVLTLNVNNLTEKQVEELPKTQTDKEYKETNTIIDNTLDIQTEKPQSLTDMTAYRQTENINISVMFEKLSEKFETMKNEQKETSVNVSKQVIGAITKVEDRLVVLNTDIKQVKVKVDGLNIKVTNLQGDVGQCCVVIANLEGGVTQNTHQIELVSTRVDENAKKINEVKESSDKIELHLAEKLLSCSLNSDRKYNVIKEEMDKSKRLVSEMCVNLKQSKDELDELKARYYRLEGAINQSKEQSNLLNNRVTDLSQNMVFGSTKDTVLMESSLHQLNSRSSINLDNNRIATPPQQGLPNVNSLPTISSTPLVSPHFCTPQAIINQPYASQYPFPYSPKHLSEEEAIMKDIRKREKAPSFDGTNISAPQFIMEAEAYFSTVNITNDGNKVRVLGSLLKDIALQWWKRIGNDIYTWEEAKNELIKQYFNDYNRKKFKLEWKEYEYEKVKDVEVFTLQAFHLLDIVKPNYSFKKKCQTVASRLPAPLMGYLLLKEFNNEREFMNILKEAMVLTNFKNDNLPSNTNGTNSNTQIINNPNNNNNSNSNNNNNTFNSNRFNNNNQNNSNNFNNNSKQPNQIITNPNFKGKPSNFDPNYKSKFYYKNNNNGNNDNGSNSRYNNQGRNSNNGNNYNNRRSWYNNQSNSNDGRQYQRPYNNSQKGNVNGKSSNSNNYGVNNVPVGPAIGKPIKTTPATTPVGNQLSVAMVPTSDVVTLPTTFFQQLLQTKMISPPVSFDGQNPTGPVQSN